MENNVKPGYSRTVNARCDETDLPLQTFSFSFVINQTMLECNSSLSDFPELPKSR